MAGELVLKGDEVRLWCVGLEATEAELGLCRSWLSEEERERADRLHFIHHQRRFVLSHGVLRWLLGHYLKLPPESIKYSYGLKGKPHSADAKHRVDFNMSHSGSLAVYAFTSSEQMGVDIGVDVEQVRPVPDMNDLAARFFSREEVADLAALDESHRREGFFNCWTRKEAYIKAIGDGLSVPLDAFSVSLRPGVPAQLLSIDGEESARSKWILHHFVPEAGYVGALGYRAPARKLVVEQRKRAGELVSRE